MKRLLLLSFLLLLARPLWAHPHIFVDTGVEMFTDDTGQLTHIKVTWAYDAFYSLLITEEFGLDPDGDAVLSAPEKAKLNGFDMEWVEGFNGDLVATLGTTEIPLSRPRDFTTDMQEGRLVTTHMRDVVGNADLTGQRLVIKPYDASYYTAYDVTYPVKVNGEAVLCEVRKEQPEMTSETNALRSALAEVSPNADPEDAGLPNAGGLFATRIEVSCSGV